MGYFYSATLGGGGFLWEGDRAAFEEGVGWPDDALPISDQWHARLMEGQRKGKLIESNSQGLPVLRSPVVDYPALAELQRADLIRTAMQSVSVIQLKLQGGRKLSEAETSQLDMVLDFIEEVESIDTATVSSEVEWPEQPVV